MISDKNLLLELKVAERYQESSKSNTKSSEEIFRNKQKKILHNVLGLPRYIFKGQLHAFSNYHVSFDVVNISKQR